MGVNYNLKYFLIIANIDKCMDVVLDNFMRIIYMKQTILCIKYVVKK